MPSTRRAMRPSLCQEESMVVRGILPAVLGNGWGWRLRTWGDVRHETNPVEVAACGHHGAGAGGHSLFQRHPGKILFHDPPSGQDRIDQHGGGIDHELLLDDGPPTFDRRPAND